MMMCGYFMLFASLGIGYVLCVLAKKEKKEMRVLGFTLGISIIVLSLLMGLVGTYAKQGMMMGGKGGVCGKMMKNCPMVKTRR